MNFLYEKYDILSNRIDKTIPDFVVNNLNRKFKIRPYQTEAFARFFDYLNNYDEKEKPYHLLFNMATGSGKTLIMAGLILYLYKKGYRNFLFFVNSNNIIEKTKGNFLGKNISKYLFDQEISFENKLVNIQQVQNFEDANPDNINICFTTIQKLHSDLYNQKENSITWEDFERYKIVLLSDEAHHLQAQSKNNIKQETLFDENGLEIIKKEKPTWENTVENIFKKNKDNLLLEFTATLFENESQELSDKYQDKVLYRYDLKEFRDDGYSKDIDILKSGLNEEGRMLQAVILNQYRQDVAGKYGINLKPIILFKAQKTIEESKQNQEKFEKIIDNLDVAEIKKLRMKIDVDIIQKALHFFKNEKITDSLLVKRLKNNFSKNKILNVNEENLDKKSLKKQDKEEIISQQKSLNSLEDKNNQVRVIFAVQKLNEGWDVLNLFDIVRLYTSRDARKGKPGKTTIAEAQLIGRGARYFPFITEDVNERYRRKFDGNLEKDLRIIEELHYHSVNDSRYIDEIRKALIQKGFIDALDEEKELKLKEEFKQTNFYKSGIVYINKQEKRSYEKINSFKDLGVFKKNIEFKLFSGLGESEKIFGEKKLKKQNVLSERDVKVLNMSENIIRVALAKNDFFDFENLKRNGLENIKSLGEFIEKYLTGLSIIFVGRKDDLKNISSDDYLEAVSDLLEEIEKEMKLAITEYIGTAKFEPVSIKKIFIDKVLKLKKGSERADGQEEFIANKNWYVFNANYGTDQEKRFVKMMDRKIDEISEGYKNVYLIRNELHFKIYNFADGQAFAPDFVLFLSKNKKDLTTYQIFIEPKGQYLREVDKWKEKFLNEIKNKFKDEVLVFNETKKYKITGIPFYSYGDENEFYENYKNVMD
ncbi:MAG: DEAD/DEAH box helicase family protein [Patescibacteria group bacterium]